MANADANGGPGGKPAGDNDGVRGPDAANGRSPSLPELLIECVWDDNGRLVKTDRFVQEHGQWRAVDPNESVPGLDEAEQAGGRWTIAWHDSESVDAATDNQTTVAPGDLPAHCPDCKGVGTVLLLTSRRPCKRCGGTGSCTG
jgi:hypothetical protein